MTHDPPRYLYHGTSSRYLASIQANGLRPRGRKKQGNWTHSQLSRADCVYLTTVYAPYFAACATDDDEPWLVLEIDAQKIDVDRLLPDEDWLEQATRRQTYLVCHGWSMQRRTAWFRRRLQMLRAYYVESLQGLGTCAYRGTIPWSAVARYVVWNPASDTGLAMNCMDPTITIINYKLCGKKYAELTQEIMQRGCVCQEHPVDHVST